MRRIILLVLICLFIWTQFQESDSCCGRRRRRRRRYTPPRDRTPPSFRPYCYRNYYLPTQITYSGLVRRFWSTPTAWDNRDGRVGVYLYSPRYLQYWYGEGYHYITYGARDRSGNTRYCKYRLHVYVPKCPYLWYPSNGYYYTTGYLSHRYRGSSVRYRCHQGYRLSGSSWRTCQNTWYSHYLSWSGTQPSCIAITCSPLSAPLHGSISCTNSFFYDSKCTYTCNSGYNLPAGASVSQTCTDTGWTGSPPSSCIDTTKPVFQNCPSSLPVIHAAPKESTAQVTWITPSATDSSGQTPVLTFQGEPSGSYLPHGIHSFSYTARDATGNTATCSFTKSVQVTTCALTSNPEELSISCDYGSLLGSTCDYSCETGSVINGSSSAICISRDGAGEWSNEQPSCTVLHCSTLEPPANGYFTNGECSTLYGTTCYFSCVLGFKIKGNNLLTCILDSGGDSVSWQGEQPECEVITCGTDLTAKNLHFVKNSSCSDLESVLYDQQCEVECNEGYRLVGSRDITCGLNSAWQMLPVCQEIRCPASGLPIPANGNKDGCTSVHSEAYGTTCTLSCDLGYRINGPDALTNVTRKCLSDAVGFGVWSGAPVSCVSVQCPPIETDTLSYVTSCNKGGVLSQDVSQPQDYNTVCMMACKEGFTADENPYRLCVLAGTWDGTDLVCKDETAPSLQKPPDVIIFNQAGQDEVIVPYDDWEPIIAIDAGMQVPSELKSINSDTLSSGIPVTLPEGIYQLVYGATDTFNNSAIISFFLTVRVTRCPGLYTPAHGNASLVSGKGSCDGGAVYGSVCEVSCDQGYALSTNQQGDDIAVSITCDRSSFDSITGSWNDSTPTCNIIECVVPESENVAVSRCVGSSAVYGDECLFQCESGFMSPDGNQFISRTCQENGLFNGMELNCSVEKTCPAHNVMENGNIFPTRCTTGAVSIGDSCYFVCNDGYVRNGQNPQLCTTDGVWSSSRAVTCIDTQPPSFTDITCPFDRYVNAERGTKQAMFEIPSLNATDNSGYVRVSVDFPSTSNLEGIFQEGTTCGIYVATDNTTEASCQLCLHVTVFRCPPPYAPAHGSLVNCKDPIYGSDCTYSCNMGYSLNGPSTRTCELNNGQGPAYWNGTQPTCEAVRCPAYMPQSMVYRSGCIANSPETEVFGTQCVLYCPFGYEGYGDSRPTCQADGTWSSNNYVCIEIFCPDLIPPPMSTSSADCLTNVTAGRSCSFSCERSGYRVTPPDRQRVTCQSDGTWLPGNMTGVTCQDVQTPMFTPCLADFTIYAPRGEVEAYAMWNLTANDNSDVEPSVQCNDSFGMKGEGFYDVRCTATDGVGNSRNCTFGITIIVRRCLLYQLPAFASYEGSCDTVWGSECNITCSSGYHLIGSNKITCEFEDNQLLWNAAQHPVCQVVECDPLVLPPNVIISPWSCSGTAMIVPGTECTLICEDGHTFVGDSSAIICENNGLWSRAVNASSDLTCLAKPCTDLSPPDNGILTCEVLPTGQVCSYSCLSGFDIPGGFSYTPLSCTFSGEWTPYTRAPDCSEESRPVEGRLTGYLCYEGTCGTNETNRQLAEEFLQAFDSSQQQSMYCREDPCTIENVEVTCGPTTSRRRRETREKRTWLPDRVLRDTRDIRVERSPAGNCDKYNVKFDIVADFDQSMNTTNFQAGLALEIRLRKLVEELIMNGSLQLNYTVMGDQVNLVASSFNNEFLLGICQTGFTAIDAYFYDCAPCIAGTYFDNSTKTCIACEKGTYQPNTSQFQCLSCPDDQSTVGNWTREITECFDICPPGYYSESGVEPCTACEVGTYQPSSLNTACLICPDRTSTKHNGSSTKDACIGCGNTPCENNATCIDLRGDYECTCTFGFTGRNCSLTVDYCSPDPCNNGGSCSTTESTMNRYECHCPEGYAGINCSTNIDECRSDPCHNDGHCIDGVNNFTCECTSYFNGDRCQTPTCDNIICQNNGTCNELGGSTAPCFCGPRYSGEFCEDSVCHDSPCKHGGTCFMGTGSGPPYICSCSDGYVGEHCEVDFNECASNPCSDHATCIDGVNNYTCNCIAGYTGSICNSLIDWCSGNPCGVNSTCVSLSDGFQCLCEFGWTGDLCDSKIDFCVDDPCTNGATCTSGLTTFTCNCPSGYQGVTCEININECESTPCANGQICTDLVAAYDCSCPPGFIGSNCTLDIDECDNNPCVYGACMNGFNSFTCICLQGYTGTLCDVEIDNCISSPCQYSGTCMSSLNGFRCQCASGFTGTLCEININDCLPDPCFKSLGCLDGIDDYTCTCKQGYKGKNCETDTNECAFTTCLNGGSCINTRGSFLCQCKTGFNGTLCEINIDDCIDNQCENGATCIDGVRRYKCQCDVGTNGIYCQYTAPPCESDPCLNGAQCVEEQDSGFVCTCLDGYEGLTCQDNIDECESNQCASGSTCIDQVNDYSCACPIDITGEYCNQVIDDCVGNLCSNGSSCIDGIASYTCSCVTGFTGEYCDADIQECASNPCGNHGSCNEQIDGYYCLCNTGYTGPHCESLISSCVSNPCMNNGTCVDGLLQYTCLCTNGYSGDKCETGISANFDFLMDHETSYISHTSKQFQSTTGLQDLTITFSIQVETGSEEDYTLFYLEVERQMELTLLNPCSLQLTLRRYPATTETFPTTKNLCDHLWHQVTLEVDFNNNDLWAYVDEINVINTSFNNGPIPLPIRGLIVELGSKTTTINSGDSLRFTNFNLWDNFLTKKNLENLKTQCQPGIFGDIKMDDLKPTAISLDVYKTPSICDDTDECVVIVPPPCRNGGTCTEGLNSYECSCPAGFIGENCEEVLDFCSAVSCLNEGTCVSNDTSAYCACPDGFTGDSCQYEMVNGGWDDWSEWGECTVTCNGGTATRNRTCSDPPPNVFGEECKGNHTEEMECNTEHCPACIELTEPSGADLSCEGEGNMTMSCTLSCKSGYSFPEDPVTFYNCSQDTGYRWNHESDDNPLAKLPSCTETVEPTEMDVSITMPYPGATCETPNDANDIAKSFNTSLNNNTESLGCRGDKVCKLTGVEVKNCGSTNGLRRRKRADSPPLAITFTAYTNSSSTETETISTNGTAAPSFADITVAFIGLSDSGAFSLEINGSVVNPATDQIIGEANTTCPHGTVTASSGGDCAACAPGTYQGVDDNEAVCIPCPIGTYQNASGQSSCIDCPEGLVTLGLYASNVSECIVACPEGSYHDKLSGDASMCALCPLNTYQDRKGQERCTSCPVKLVTLEIGSSGEDDCVLICDAGFFVDLYNISDPVCTQCPLNTYKEDEGPEEMCTDCPDGYITLNRNSVNESDCIETFEPTSAIPGREEENSYPIVVEIIVPVVVVVLLVIIVAGIVVYWKNKTGRLMKNEVVPSTTDIQIGLLSTPEPEEITPRTMNTMTTPM